MRRPTCAEGQLPGERWVEVPSSFSISLGASKDEKRARAIFSVRRQTNKESIEADEKKKFEEK